MKYKIQEIKKEIELAEKKASEVALLEKAKKLGIDTTKYEIKDDVKDKETSEEEKKRILELGEKEKEQETDKKGEKDKSSEDKNNHKSGYSDEQLDKLGQTLIDGISKVVSGNEDKKEQPTIKL